MILFDRRGLFVLCITLAWAACVYLENAAHKPIPAGEPTPAPQGEGWINLLAPPNTGQWRNITDARNIFEIEGDMLHIFGSAFPPLRYVGYGAQTFADFDLHLEFKLTPRANSGVFLRVQEGNPVQRGFELQVLDDFGTPPNKNGSAALYDIASPMFNMARPPGQWNSYDISLSGTALEVTMNGWRVLHTDFAPMKTPLGKFTIPYADLPRQGLLALQDHGGEVWYRNIYIRPR